MLAGYHLQVLPGSAIVDPDRHARKLLAVFWIQSNPQYPDSENIMEQS
jgi:hypothetical protein